MGVLKVLLLLEKYPAIKALPTNRHAIRLLMDSGI